MFRRRSTDKDRVEPELCVLLRNVARYPGDVLQGVAIIDFGSPVDLLTLEVRLSGEERTTLGGLLTTEKNPEARKTLYYEQFVTLRGVDHNSLEQRRGLLGRRRTVVAQNSAALHKSSSSILSLEGPSTENSISNLSPSVIDAAASGGHSVHLVPGTYSFPFKVVLPDTLPQTRELQRGREGMSVLRYRAVATMILVGGKAYTAETPFRVNPLPVQVQRWYQLHGDEQNGTDVLEADEAVATGNIGSPLLEGGATRPALKSMLMSSPGTMSTDAADREPEMTCQRRIQHYRQFPEHQLAAERAEYEKRAEAQTGKKGMNDDDDDAVPSSSHRVQVKAEDTNNRKQRPSTYRERRARHDEADNRSLDDNTGGAASAADDDNENDYDDDEVHAFEMNTTDERAISPPEKSTSSGKAAANKGDLATSAGVDVANKKKKKHRHHNKSRGGDDKITVEVRDSAMVEDNVAQLAFTPPGEELAPVPAHLAVRHSVDTTNSDAAAEKEKASSRHTSRKKKESSGAEGEDDEDQIQRGEDNSTVEVKSRGTQAHRRRPRFVPPPWHQEFNIHLRSGFLRTGKVKVKLSLRSPLVSVSYGKVMVKLLVDNSDGSGTITRVKYSLITRCYIRTKTEVYNYHVDAVETITDVNIEKGNIVAIPEVEVPVPRFAPLTMLTEGQGTLTFLNVRFYVGTTLKTFSKSVETEVLLVSGLDSRNNSRRLLRWTCFYRRRNRDDTRELTVRPPTINLSEQNAKVQVMQAAEHVRPASASFVHNNNGTDADISSMAPSAMSRSLAIMRSSRRVAKDAPSLDTRRLASALNYDVAIFVPPAEDAGPGGPSSHADPMSMLNPFASPSATTGSTLPLAD